MKVRVFNNEASLEPISDGVIEISAELHPLEPTTKRPGTTESNVDEGSQRA